MAFTSRIGWPAWLMAILGLAAAAHADPRFIVLDDASTERVESCPIRVELPLAPLFAGKLPYRTAKAVRVQCDGAYISLITAKWPSGHRAGRVHAQARIFQPAGFDQEYRINYYLMDGETVLASGRELMGADEGAVNWEDGVTLGYSPAKDPGMRASLRIEVVPTEGIPGASPGACTTDQILKMKDAGLSDEQIKGACGG